MNVFILCTGRCGSTTFIKACEHIVNYTSSHESMFGRPAVERFGNKGYKNRHIEADTNMAWFMGPLREKYGDSVYYVHLKRDRVDTANSIMGQIGRGGFADAYAGTLFMSNTAPREDMEESALTMCQDYVDTVTANIDWFLQCHPPSMQTTINIDSPGDRFSQFWQEIEAKGSLGAALREFNTRYNASQEALCQQL